MSKAAITIRTSQKDKQAITRFAHSVGLSTSAFANVVLRRAVDEGSITLSPTLEPTPYLERIMRKADADIKAGRNLSPVFDDVDEMFDHMKKNTGA